MNSGSSDRSSGNRSSGNFKAAGPGSREPVSRDFEGRIMVVHFTASARDTARKIALLLGADIADLGSGQDSDSKDNGGKGDNGGFLQDLFRDGTGIIGVCASGILMRLLAPVLDKKHDEPPLLAVSADGGFVVPLLGGHRGGNALARRIADVLGGLAAITTASDTVAGFALDDPPPGYVLANPDAAKGAMAAVLNGEALAVSGNGKWLLEAGYETSSSGRIKVIVSEFARPGHWDGESLLYHPATLVAGVGCARGTGADEVIGLVQRSLASAQLSPESLAALATIDIKSDEAALHEAAEHFAVPLKLFSPAQLAANARRVPNPSPVVMEETGTPSVAEAAALFAGELLVEKQKTANATCAIGRSEMPVDLAGFGHDPGCLHLVGIGPGSTDQRTIDAVRALRDCRHWVGYSLYLDLIADLHLSQHQHRFGLGDEEERVRFAMELAAKGSNVALVCSGDAQIYAMASLVYELMQAEGRRAVSAAARRLQVISHPGISALQTVSAKAGALLGHDFCAISLSDLLTPRKDIKNRLLAAARGDFVTALYNPRSRRRTELLEMARELYLQHRPPDTPVLVGTNLGRRGESLNITTLEAFEPEKVDMLTIVLFGSSASRSFMRGNGRVAAFTPRGYAGKGSEPGGVE